MVFLASTVGNSWDNVNVIIYLLDIIDKQPFIKFFLQTLNLQKIWKQSKNYGFFGFFPPPRRVEKKSFSQFAQGISTQMKRSAENKMLNTKTLRKFMV